MLQLLAHLYSLPVLKDVCVLRHFFGMCIILDWHPFLLYSKYNDNNDFCFHSILCYFALSDPGAAPPTIGLISGVNMLQSYCC